MILHQEMSGVDQQYLYFVNGACPLFFFMVVSADADQLMLILNRIKNF